MRWLRPVERVTVESLEAMPPVGTRWIGPWEFVRYVSDGEAVWTARKRQDEPIVEFGPADAATIVALCHGDPPSPPRSAALPGPADKPRPAPAGHSPRSR